MKNYMNSDISTTRLFCHVQQNSNIIRIGPLLPSKSDQKLKRRMGRMEEKNYKGRWTKSEHNAFVKGKQRLQIGLINYGKQWKKLQKCVPTRTVIQIRTHAQKFFIKLGQILPRGTNPMQYLKKTSAKSFSKLIKDYNEINPKAFSFSLTPDSGGTRFAGRHRRPQRKPKE